MRVPDLDGMSPEPDRRRVEPQQKDVLGDLAQQLRELWIVEMRRHSQRTYGRACQYKPGPSLDGGIDATGRKYNSVWPKLADFIYKNKISPATFLKAQFENCRGYPPKSPNMLMGSKALNRYRMYLLNHEELTTLQIAKDAQIRTARDAIEINKLLYQGMDVYRAAILDLNLPLTALFRYSLAHQCLDDKLMKLYHDPAMSQYLYEQEAYDKVWGDLIPSSFRQEAIKLRERLLGKESA